MFGKKSIPRHGLKLGFIAHRGPVTSTSQIGLLRAVPKNYTFSSVCSQSDGLMWIHANNPTSQQSAQQPLHQRFIPGKYRHLNIRKTLFNLCLQLNPTDPLKAVLI